MNTTIELLDCTLRDGSYITGSEFGSSTLKGIIKRLADAKVEIIECGWLKDTPHKEGTAYYNTPADLVPYLSGCKSPNSTYAVMIDYNRYDLSQLPQNDGSSIDAIRVVFPHDHVDDGLALAEPIRAKGYDVMFQAANTLAYSDSEILELIDKVNKIKPVSISIVDTFGAMYGDDLTRILSLFIHNLDPKIKIGLHGHNNLQLSFSLAIQFAALMTSANRSFIVDSSLCGMGRGAGNANTELVANYLNQKYKKDYDLNIILDTIDMYMTQFLNKYEWGYSTPYFISGMYQAHVNNIAYLSKNHKTKARDMKLIIESLDTDTRRIYDYDNLEDVYVEYMNHEVDDLKTKEQLRNIIGGKNVVLIAPGSTSSTHQNEVLKYITENNAIVIGINAFLDGYNYDYMFISNPMRYDYAKESASDFNNVKKIITSNIDLDNEASAFIVNYNDLISRGFKHSDSAVILALKLLDFMVPSSIAIAGLDGYDINTNYFDKNLEISISQEDRLEFNSDLKAMLNDFIETHADRMSVKLITPSKLF